MNSLEDWAAFVLACGGEIVLWFRSMKIFNVSLGAILVGFFLLGFIMRSIIARA